MTDYDDLEKVKVTREGHVTVLSMNRPEARNAMNGELTHDMREALRRVATDEEARAVLIRGEGKSFCAGGDMKMFDEMARSETPPSPAKRVADLLGAAEMVELILAIPQPTVAAVQGHAIGLGSTIALFCDIVIAAEDAQIADMHVNIGVVAGDGGVIMWPLMMPIGAARWYLMTGDRLSGSEAERLGMALKAVPEDQLYEEALSAATRLAELPPIAMQGTKATINKIVQDRMNLTLDFGLLYEGATYLSEDHKEAAAAFVEKRKPRFTGR